METTTQSNQESVFGGEPNKEAILHTPPPPPAKAGRPKGSKGAKTLLKERMVDKSEQRLLRDLHKVVDIVVEKAQEGDLTACKMVFDRFFPVAKQTDGTKEDTKKVINIVVQTAGGGEVNVTNSSKKKKKADIVEAEYEEVSNE